MFVTLDQVKQRLRITSTVEDVDLQSLMDQAEAHIVNWCSVTPRSAAVVAAWTAETVPSVVVAAILVQVGELDRFRGDDPEGPQRPEGDGPAILVRELLRPYHDAVVA
jgi:hypothetical protein